MGRVIPLGVAIVLLTAADVDAGAGADDASRAVLGALLGPGLLAATDVVAGTGGVVAAEGRAGWITQELLAPLAARFAREGYILTFDPGFVAWVGDHLPADGETPEAYLDRAVTPALAAALPAVPGPVVARMDGATPVLEPAH